MSESRDGPATAGFRTVSFNGNITLAGLSRAAVSKEMKKAASEAPTGRCVSWGIPFRIDRAVLVRNKPVTVKLKGLKAGWLVFMHTSDVRPLRRNRHGFTSPARGIGQLGEHAADYVMVYADGSETRAVVRRRHEIGAISRRWGENCVESVAHRKPHPVRPHHEQMTPGWGLSQTRANNPDSLPWTNWLWAWENPFPEKAVTAVRFEPLSGAVVVSAISVGNPKSNPLRWRTRRKAVLKLPRAEEFDPEMNEAGLLSQIRLDMGQVISALPRPIYPDRTWNKTYNNKLPGVSKREILVEYTSHREASFHLAGGGTVPVSELESKGAAGRLKVVTPATQRVTLRVLEKRSRRKVPVKLHVHGKVGEYLAPVDRHRIPNGAWFEDYSVDFLHVGRHWCAYIPGETVIDLPIGKVYVEISKGFEIKPVRKAVHVTRKTRKITIEVEKLLPWREKGWVSADTHVHFLSPQSAMLEGSAEGVNIVNLLASQWGELMTNVGDFDGKTTFGSKKAGGDGEYLVRVGTENRQHVMGHISLLGYDGNIIAPMTTGGANESALGDPVGVLLTQWARQCKKQGGVVVLPHFPNPRMEGAAAIVDGSVDCVEMTAWGNLYGGIDPYSLSDWYRYLNCGYMVAVVGGTDKMSAATAVGAVRTYAQVKGEFTYDAWKEAVADGRTFVTFGPLLEFCVEGRTPGSRIKMKSSGGTVDVEWQAASVTIPMSRVELVVNGEIVNGQEVGPWAAKGHWSIKLDRSSWLAILVRGHYKDKPEVIAAHSSPVVVELKNLPFYSAADALTILEQIEGSLAYLDTVGTRADDAAYKRMRMILVGAHRKLHNRMHAQGFDHKHNVTTDHGEHHNECRH